MGYLTDLFTKWAAQKKRWPLLLLFIIPVWFELVQQYHELSFRDALINGWFLIGAGVILVTTALLYLIVSRRKLSPLPKDKLVVTITTFVPVGDAAGDDALTIPHRIAEQLQHRQAKGAPLKIKRSKVSVTGATDEVRQETALVLGRSSKDQAHVVIWGDVRRDEGELYVHPRLTIANPLGAVPMEGRELGPSINTGPDHLVFKETLASEVADLITLIHGLAYFRGKNWNQAVDILTPLHTFAGHFYLGLAFQSRAQRLATPQADLRAAITAYRAALEVYTRDDLPQDWAMTQNNLGNALRTLGERTTGEEGNRLLSEAVAACRAALEVRTRDDLPQDWATTQNNLGVVLRDQGKRTAGEEGKRLLSEAVAACRAALEVYTREDLPLDWAMTQNNLGNAMRTLGEHTTGEEGNRLLSKAVAACRAALEVFTRDDLPHDWAMTQNSLGNALSDLGKRTAGEEGNRLLSEAVAAYRAALEVFTEEHSPYLWDMTRQSLETALEALEQREKKK